MIRCQSDPAIPLLGIYHEKRVHASSNRQVRKWACGFLHHTHIPHGPPNSKPPEGTSAVE